MSSPSGMVYVQNDFSEPMSAQYNFSNQFDLSHPDQAMASYQRIMHEHTKQQFEIATASSRRRNSPPQHSINFRPQSSHGSVQSTAS
ncbi:hypothetical protein H2203_001844 [Taxawa tesnikishii (nom. ined.)]|nr:hypothetical protein H2203_001844 [Dothideales sp. JES 119]